MRVRLMAEIIDDNGEKLIKPVEIEAKIPDIEEFGNRAQFYEVFDRYEQPVLEARTQLLEELTKGYLDEAAAIKKRAPERKW